MQSFNKFLICILLGSSLFSCKKSFQVEELSVDPINSKFLVFDTTEYAHHRNPRFLYQHYLKTSGELRNISGQTLENIELIPTIEISYKNELDQVINLPSRAISKNTLNAKKISWSSVYNLEDSESFKKKILLHEAKDVIFKLKIKGTNSIGFETEKEAPYAYEHDITDEWNSFHRFYNDSTYSNLYDAFVNYTPQFSSWIKEFNQWNEPSLKKIIRFYNSEESINNYDRTGWHSTALNFNNSQKLLFNNFYKDLKSSNSTKKIEKNWELFMLHFTQMMDTRIKINEELESIISFKKNIESKFQSPQKEKFNVKTLKFEENKNYPLEYDIYKRNLEKALEPYPAMFENSKQTVNNLIDSLHLHKKEALGYYSASHNEILEMIELQKISNDIVNSYSIF